MITSTAAVILAFDSYSHSVPLARPSLDIAVVMFQLVTQAQYYDH